jgi:hypothetical protein
MTIPIASCDFRLTRDVYQDKSKPVQVSGIIVWCCRVDFLANRLVWTHLNTVANASGLRRLDLAVISVQLCC